MTGHLWLKWYPAVVPEVCLVFSPHERAAREPRSVELESRSGEKAYNRCLENPAFDLCVGNLCILASLVDRYLSEVGFTCLFHM